MSMPAPQGDGCPINKEYVGVPPPPNVHLPTSSELLDLCPPNTPRGHTTLPSDSPIFWVKYGYAVYWNEVVAQSRAYHELRALGSSVRAPAVFYAFQDKSATYIVMEYIPGRTARKCIEEAKTEAEKEHVMDQVGLSLSELHRIPIASGSRPAAIDGGLIQHELFDEQEAPRHYENVEQLEIHFNEFLKHARTTERIANLSLEPMVFCQSDYWPDNFMIDDAGSPVVIDFSDVSILPSSFASCAAKWNGIGFQNLGFDIFERVWFPTTDGVDNTQALLVARGRMPLRWAVFVQLGKMLPGGDTETQLRLESSAEGLFNTCSTVGEK
ncbi:kinase-like domain-containing protein [Xylaria telfairii]|nr:kinase-like domain-containing protein [Xylaria telfairii]